MNSNGDKQNPTIADPEIIATELNGEGARHDQELAAVAERAAGNGGRA